MWCCLVRCQGFGVMGRGEVRCGVAWLGGGMVLVWCGMTWSGMVRYK